MRKIVASPFISLDGVVESPDQWQFDAFDGDMMSEMTEAIGRQDAILLGRVTYEEWSNYWPTATDEPYASFINNTPKYVVSSTLDSVSWGDKGKVSLLQGDPLAEIAKLKQQPGGDIGVQGSMTLIRSLLQAGLIDELTLLVHPVVVKKGNRLFEGGELQRLKLLDSRKTSSGVAILVYGPHRD